MPSSRQPLIAEFTGSAFLAATVIGSGIAALKLSGGNAALALLANAVATGCMLVVIIMLFGPVSGAHFNPAVSFAFALRGEMRPSRAALYAVMQTAGMVSGACVAHAMFDLQLLQVSGTARVGQGTLIGEIVATFGLVLLILGLKDKGAGQIPAAVGLYITAAYWFTSSTSFANPAITVARSLSDTFAGIAPESIPLFLAGQCVGVVLALCLAHLLFARISEN